MLTNCETLQELTEYLQLTLKVRTGKQAPEGLILPEEFLFKFAESGRSTPRRLRDPSCQRDGVLRTLPNLRCGTGP